MWLTGDLSDVVTGNQHIHISWAQGMYGSEARGRKVHKGEVPSMCDITILYPVQLATTRTISTYSVGYNSNKLT